MNLALLLPVALAALAALLLPLLLHLARRSEEKRTVFAALRWLREKPKPRQRLRFDEWPLLILRLLLLALIALWLARPVLFGAATKTPWIVAAPGVPVEQVRALAGDGKAELHWLAPGFPSLDETAPGSDVPFASLLRELDAQLPADAKLSVVVPEQLQGADAERPRLSRVVQWKIVPGAMPAAATTKLVAPKLDLSQVDAGTPGLRYLRAVATAWQADATTTGDPLRIWLSADPLPPALQQWIREGGTALIAARTSAPKLAFAATTWRDAQGDALLESARWEHGRVLRFTRELAPATMPALLDADFPQHLREALQPPSAPARALAADYAPQTGAAPYSQAPHELQSWLALLIALLFVVERWLATRRQRAVSP